MTSPLTSSKVLLVPDARGGAGAQAGVAVRRYRIARLRFEPRDSGGDGRFAHLKRSYD